MLVPKTITQPCSSTKLLMNVMEANFFSFIDGFFDYNQINILSSDQHKNAFICPWGTFSYHKLPFGLKNVGATFQREMNYPF